MWSEVIQEEKKRKPETLYSKFRALDELLADNSRGLGTALQQIPLDLFFYVIKHQKKRFSFPSTQFACWLSCILTLSPVPAVIMTFLLEHLSAETRSSLLSAFPKNCVQHDPFPLECPCVLLPLCDSPGSVSLEWDFLLKVHGWVERHRNWNKLPQINYQCQLAEEPGQAMECEPTFHPCWSLHWILLDKDWGTVAESWVRSVYFSSTQKHFWV